MILEPKKDIVYGPVSSRRLGRSLGINLFPGDRKICPFDCVYCQYGWTRSPAAAVDRDAVRLPGPADVERALERALAEADRPPAFITFSGNGEPTLHPEFREIVGRVLSVRDRLAPGARTAVLSNSALVARPGVRRALLGLDARIMKLDCGTEEAFRRFNRPCPGISLDGISEGLARLAAEVPVTLQTLAAAGGDGNMEGGRLPGWVRRLSVIRPAAVQLYTLDRGHPSPALLPAAPRILRGIQEEAAGRGLNVEVFPGRSKPVRIPGAECPAGSGSRTS